MNKRTIEPNEPLIYTRDDIADLHVEPIHVYSCRAESQLDVMNFITLLLSSTKRIMHIMIIPDARYPDTLLEFGLKEEGDKEVIAILRNQIDSHVMLETMKRCPLKDNNYSRVYGPGQLELEVDGKLQ